MWLISKLQRWYGSEKAISKDRWKWLFISCGTGHLWINFALKELSKFFLNLSFQKSTFLIECHYIIFQTQYRKVRTLQIAHRHHQIPYIYLCTECLHLQFGYAQQESFLLNLAKKVAARITLKNWISCDHIHELSMRKIVVV